jgi:hypothetical protein
VNSGGTPQGPLAPIGWAVDTIVRGLAPTEYAFVTALSPEECLARMLARVPPRRPSALLPWGGGLALPDGDRVFLESGPRWFRLSQACRKGGLRVGLGYIGAGYSADWVLEVEAVLTPTPGGALLEVVVGCADEDAANGTGVLVFAVAAFGALLALAGLRPVTTALAVATAALAVAAFIYWRRRATPSAATQAPVLKLMAETLELRAAPVQPSGVRLSSLRKKTKRSISA